MALSVNQSKQIGFSIIEVLIALMIIGSGLLGMVKLQMAVTGSGPVAKQRSEAVHLGQKKIEDLRSFTSVTAYDAYFGGSTSATGTQTITGENATYTLIWNLTDRNSAVAGRYADVVLTVTWSDQKSEPQTVRMQSSFARVTPSDAGNLLTADQTTTVVCTSGAAQSWTVGGVTCNGSIGSAGSNGTTVNVVATTNTGSNQFVCGSNGQWTEVSSFAKSCTWACSPGTQNWLGSSNEACSADLGGASIGTSSSVQDNVAPVTGTATFTCGATGAWEASNTTCKANCSSGQTFYWGSPLSCSGTSIQGTSDASTAPKIMNLSYTASTISGNATYSCDIYGSWQLSASPASTCVNSPSACSGGTLYWGSNPQCSASVLQTASGNSSGPLTNTAVGATGTATFACSAGSWTATSSSCTASPSPCSAGTLSWGSNPTCSASVSQTASGNSSGPLTNTAVGATGTATFACSAGSWTATSSSCTASPSPCSAGTLSWGSNPTCSASVSQTASGQIVSNLTNTAAGATGTATFACSSGSWTATSSSCSCAITFSGSVNPNPTIYMKVLNSNDSTYANITGYCQIGTQIGSSGKYNYSCNSAPVTSGSKYTIKAVSGSITKIVNITNSNKGVVCGDTYDNVKID